MTTYAWRGGAFVDKATGKRMRTPKRDGVCMPLAIIGDVEPHMAPSGAYISGRKALRDDCRAHGYVPYERLTKRPTGLTDPTFAKSIGGRVCDETQDWLKTQKTKYLAPAEKNKVSS